MGNKGLQVLILLHVYKNISDNIYLAAVTNEFIHRKDKETFRFFFRIIHNICKIKLTLRY